MWHPNKIRLVLWGLLVASTFVLPWWLTLGIALILAIRFAAWEIVPVGMYMDFIALPVEHALIFPYATLAAIFLVIALEPLRRQLLIS
jgi:hypothetical protein